MAKSKETIKDLLGDEEFQGLDRLVSMGDKAVPQLKKTLEQDEDPLMRQRAAVALGRIDSAKAGDALEASLGDRNAPVVMACLDGLARHQRSDCVDRIKKVGRRKDASVRRSAVRALADLGGASDRRWVQGVLDRDEVEMVREAAAEALNQLSE